MARGDDSIRLLARLEAKIEMFNLMLVDKDAQIERLNKQVEVLQEALVVKEAPELYRDKIYAQNQAALTKEELEEIAENKQSQRIMQQYHDEFDADRNILQTPEDLEAAFQPLFIETTEPGPSGPAGYESES